MELPIELRLAIENLMEGVEFNHLAKDAKSLSNQYRTQSGQGKRLLTDAGEAIAYSLVRMPATYGAVYSALSHTLDVANCNLETLLDVGAGTGAASWAAYFLLDLTHITCVEREDAMILTGKRLMSEGAEVLREAQWIRRDLTQDRIAEKADLVIASYVLNEMDDTSRIRAVDKLWDLTDQVLLIVEPGTPVGFAQLRRAREYLLTKDAHLAAPCPHQGSCPLAEDDWCHFYCRIQRSRMHRLLKEGEVPYEDEKFAYMAFTRDRCGDSTGRILRHPLVDKGRISLDICGRKGIDKVVISKKEGTLYKKARKAQWGDTWEDAGDM